MRIAVFDARAYDRAALVARNAAFGHDLRFLEPRLDRDTASLAAGSRCACSFVNDRVCRAALEELRRVGVGLLALRCAGFNHVEVEAARDLGIRVTRVPAYSPHAIAEHTIALALALDRKIHKAYLRVREANFALDGLVGFDLHGKTVGIVGTGKIGAIVARLFHAFGCPILAHDPFPDETLAAEIGARYVAKDDLLAASDIVTLHLPLTPETRHFIDKPAIARMRPGVMIVNTGRGALIDTRALIAGLKSGRVGSAALDVYEEEEKLFFRDRSTEVLQDDVLARLLTFGNVLVTAHQAFLTREALEAIAETTLESARRFEAGLPLENEVRP